VFICEIREGENDIVEHDDDEEAEEHDRYQPITGGKLEACFGFVGKGSDNTDSRNDEANDRSIDDLAELVFGLVQSVELVSTVPCFDLLNAQRSRKGWRNTYFPNQYMMASIRSIPPAQT
jgi:hypothetical protein